MSDRAYMKPTTPPDHSKSVLVVDDEEAVLALLKRLLSRLGFNVLTASNGKDALTVLRTVHDLPVLILLDLRMPVMDGWQFRKEQKNDPRLFKIPVVVITSVQTVQDDVASIDAAAFFKKPIQQDLLVKTIRRFL